MFQRAEDIDSQDEDALTNMKYSEEQRNSDLLSVSDGEDSKTVQEVPSSSKPRTVQNIPQSLITQSFPNFRMKQRQTNDEMVWWDFIRKKNEKCLDSNLVQFWMPDFDDSDFEEEERWAKDSSIRISPTKRDSLFVEHESW